MYYWGDCSIRVSWLRIFICSCILFYNSLNFDPIIFSFRQSSLRWIVHNHSNFQMILPCGLPDRSRNSWSSTTQKSIALFFTEVEVGLILLSSRTRLISNHQKAPLKCSIQLHTKFQLFSSNVGMSTVRSLYTRINICISVKLCCVVTKIGTRILLYKPYQCTKF